MAQLRNRGSNVWQIGIFLGKDDEGKKISHYETFYGTKPQARDYANRLEVSLKDKKNLPKAHSMTFCDLFNKFLEYKLNKIEKSTYLKYEGQLEKLNKLIGDLYLYSTNPEQIEERLLLLKKEKLEPRTIKNYYDMLRNVVNWGSGKKYLSKEIINGIEPPALGHKKRDILNPNELKIFIQTAKEYKHYLPLKILALTGMRIGEVMGLKWESVFLNEKKIKIIEAVNSRIVYDKSTKTENSKRELELDDETIKELRVHKIKMSKQNRASKSDYVFQSDDHKHLRYQVVLRAKERVLKKAGLHHIRIHDLRHGVGSIMLDKGFSITSVAEQLGQVPATTAGNYAHALKKGKSLAGIL